MTSPAPVILAARDARSAKTRAQLSLGRLRGRIAAFAVLVNLVVALAIALQLFNAWKREKEHAAENVENLNHVLGGNLISLFSRVDYALATIGDEATQKMRDGPIDWSALQTFVDRQASRLEGVAGIRVADAGGDVRIASNERLTVPINVADRARFRTLRDTPDVNVVISKPELGRISGQWVITYARRLTTPAGEFAGEAHVSMPTTLFTRMFGSLNLGPHGVVSLWDSSPSTIARYPDVDHPGGVIALAPPPSSELRRLFASGATSAAYQATSGTDGVTRTYYFQRLGQLPLYLIIGLAVQDYAGEWYQHAFELAGLFALIAFMSIAGGIALYARAAARLSTEGQLRLAAMVYDNSAEGMIVIDPDGSVLGVNNAFVSITGFSRAEMEGVRISSLPGHDARRHLFPHISSTLAKEGHWKGELTCVKASGESFIVRASASAIFEDTNGFKRVVVLFSDITEQKKTQEAVWRHANFDGLTQLPNRRMFRERLEEEISHVQNTGAKLAVIFIDLDRFKDVNDSLGHEMGDKLLQAAAHRIRNCVRASDIVARLGGDEFTVVLSDLVDADAAAQISASIVEALAAPYLLAGEARFVSASLGVTFCPDDAGDAEALVRNADLAMYEAKRSGRNRFIFFKPHMQKATNARAGIANDLHRALQDEQFELHYQPIVTLATGEVAKAEALIRWRHPTRGLILPGEFIPIAEETGIIADIGDWVFRAAAQQTAKWRDEFGARICVSVNVSPAQFRQGARRMQGYAELLRKFGLGEGEMVVEITEGVLLDATADVRMMLAGLREAGVRIALDDFGTGYSSLAYLKQFDINYLKIDRAFIRGLADDASDLAICEAIIVMAHRLGIEVVAEGIETDAQRLLLVGSRCDFGQGYLFNRPLPVDKFIQCYLTPAEAARSMQKRARG